MKMKAKKIMVILLSTMLISVWLHSNSFGNEIEKKHLEVNNSQNLQRFTDDFFKGNMEKQVREKLGQAHNPPPLP